MSLVSLSSESSELNTLSQAPFDFKNYFPQPLVLRPNSQVCVSSITFSGFVGTEFNIIGNDSPLSFTGNNKLLFGFADTKYTYNYDVAILNPAVYSGPELATEIARAMNEANRLKHWEFSCTFTAGNPQANPITEDQFTISYQASAVVPPFTAGNWSVATTEIMNAGNAIITPINDIGTTFPEPATRIAILDTNTPGPDYRGNAIAFAWQKGLAQYVSTDGHGGGSCQFTIHSDGDGLNYVSDPIFPSCRFGVTIPTFVGKGLEGVTDIASPEMSYNGSNIISISTHHNNIANANVMAIHANLRVFDADHEGEASFSDSESALLRVLNLDGILTSKQDVLMVRFTPFYPTGDFVVQLFKSTDRGETFASIPDATGGNNSGTDTSPKIFTTTLDANFSAFDSCIYATSFPLANPQGPSSEPQFNLYEPATIALIPFVDIQRRMEFAPRAESNVITGLNLTNNIYDQPVTAELDTDGGTRTANTIYTIQFDGDATNGYQGTISITTPPVSDTSDVPSTEIVGRAFQQDPNTRLFTRFLLYADNTVPVGTAVPIGSITLDPTNDKFTIVSSSFTSGQDWVGTILDPTNSRPETFTTPYFIDTQMMENVDDTISYKYRSRFPIGALSPYSSLNPGVAPTQAVPYATVGAAQVITNVSRFITGIITQDDISRNGEGPARRLEVSFERVANVQEVLGFVETSYELDENTTALSTDARPRKNLPNGQKQIHISIPELSNVKSLEGESAQRYKTIKVLPKTTFTEDPNDSTVSYSADYEDFIDINNASTLQINELTAQLRNADGKLAKFVDGTTRLTIKFREDPEAKRERMMQSVIQKMSALKDPQAELMVTNFVGS